MLLARCMLAACMLNMAAPSAADGPAHDHADGGNTRILAGNGGRMWLDEMKDVTPSAFLPLEGIPFSFLYDGKSSEMFLRAWPRTCQKKRSESQTRQVIQWKDPATRLKVTAEVTAFHDFPAVEWMLRFENGGKEDAPMLEQVQALDVTLGTAATPPVMLDRINGDDCSERSFLPFLQELAPGKSERFAPQGGRPSNGAFPFFNILQEDRNLFVAIGWTGQWAASVNRLEDGATRVMAGMELVHLRLHPGEAIRTPRILLMRSDGHRIAAHNQFRRLLLAHYIPKTDGQTWRPAIGSQSFNMSYGGRRPEWNTEPGQIAAAKITRQLGCDTHWLDAAWFEGGFPNGVGNWTVRPQEYPNGLKPVADACHALGLKFLIWWEPERVAPGTKIAREHSEFVLGGADGGLFNLGNPKARRWVTALLLRQIDEFGVDTYRNDFNMDPLPFWRKNDPPDRQGITEIRYVEGFYQMWDEIRARHPGIRMDDCASGGRRIDLEMCTRAIVQTRSDTACTPGRADWDQVQTCGLSLFLPVHATIGWATLPYDCRSTATAGFLGEWDILDPAFPREEAAARIAELKANQPYWYGDFYPLTPCTLAADQWIAWQLHRSDLDEGIVLAFRRADSPYASLQVKLGGLKAAQLYEATWMAEDHAPTVRKIAGAELAGMELQLPKPRTSVLVRYKAIKD